MRVYKKTIIGKLALHIDKIQTFSFVLSFIQAYAILILLEDKSNFWTTDLTHHESDWNGVLLALRIIQVTGAAVIFLTLTLKLSFL